MAMECGGNKVVETRKEVVMQWNAMVMKLKKQEKKLQWSGMRW
jgi:pyruvate dehydrogenase complex dehydrogenase (E1) component